MSSDDTNQGITGRSKVRGIVAGLIGFVVVAVAGFLLVNYLAGGAPQVGYSVEDNWNKTIGSLGVVPIFPPEEDLVVGDILATVIQDEDPDPNISETDNLARRSFVGRSVKLAHVDLSKELDEAYRPLPVFPATAGEGPLRARVARQFSDAVLQSNLPRAAFPRLKIQGYDSAAGGISSGTGGAAGYGASNQQYAEFELIDVRTYGLPSFQALQLFEAYCNAEATRNVCTEATARKHLKRIVGERINSRYLATNGDFEHATKVEIAMVYRVYLTSTIRDLRRVQGSRSGWFRAIFSGGGSEEASPPRSAEPPPAQPTNGVAGTDQLEDLKKRLASLEQQVAKIRTGGVLSYDSYSGRESSIEGTFERPVAIAYRSIAVDFTAEPTQKSQP